MPDVAPHLLDGAKAAAERFLALESQAAVERQGWAQAQRGLADDLLARLLVKVMQERREFSATDTHGVINTITSQMRCGTDVLQRALAANVFAIVPVGRRQYKLALKDGGFTEQDLAAFPKALAAVKEILAPGTDKLAALR